MKRFLLSMAILGVIVPSCVKNDPEFTNNEVIIGFDSPMLYTNNNTKVSVFGEYGSFKYGTMDYTYPREEKIKMFAVHHEGDFTSWSAHTPADFNGAIIGYDSGFDAWVPKNGNDYYYFHGNHKLSYAAMSPADLTKDEGKSYAAPSSENPLFDVPYNPTVSFGDNGLSIQNFRVSNDPTKHFELLYSDIHKNKLPADKTNSADYYSGLPISFKHALSSIHFSLVKSQSIDQEVVLTKITLSNIQCKGDFNQGIDNNGNSHPTWTIPTNERVVCNFEPFTCNEGEGVSFPKNPQYISSLLTQQGTTNKGTSSPLLLIPQPIANSNITMRIDYKVGSTSTFREIVFSAISFNEIDGEAITSWLPGYRYTFRLNYSDATHANDIIYFAPSTDPWPNAKIIQINL